MRCVFLVGFFGSGKTSVGRELSRLLACPFYDTDRLVEKEAGCSIEEIFSKSGEGSFRRTEWRALCSLSGCQPGVVATGAAIFLSRPHRELMGRLGVSVWLDAPINEIRERLKKVGTTFRYMNQEHLLALYQRRKRSYTLADYRVCTKGKSTSEIAAEIASLIDRIRTSVLPWR